MNILKVFYLCVYVNLDQCCKIHVKKEVFMNITDIRRENLRDYIADKYKTRKEFAEKIGKASSQVNAWFAKSSAKKEIGEKLARSLEETLQLPYGWLDRTQRTYEYEFVEALQKLGYKVSNNKETFEYNETMVTPKFRVQNSVDSFLFINISNPFINKTLIKLVNGLNLFHSNNHPKNAVLLLCEDDLVFAKNGGLQNIIDERLSMARFGSPYIETDFLISVESLKFEEKPSNFWGVVKQFWSKVSKENEHENAVLMAKQLLLSKGFQVIEAPRSESGRLMVMNKSLWSMPSLIVHLPDKSKSFYIDIYPEKRLGIIPVLPDNKFAEILFVKQSEVIDILPMVNNHISKLFG